MRLIPKCLLFVSFLLLLGFIAFHRWQRNEPRRRSLQALSALNEALASSHPASILPLVVVPHHLQKHSDEEQVEFLRKALKGEISSEGVRLVATSASFGPLIQIFPVEAEAWASEAGVEKNNCVAFRLDRSGVRTEVVLSKSGDDSYRILRCNNVKSMPSKGAQHAF